MKEIKKILSSIQNNVDEIVKRNNALSEENEILNNQLEALNKELLMLKDVKNQSSDKSLNPLGIRLNNENREKVKEDILRFVANLDVIINYLK